jgi:phage shock protein A
MNDYILTGKRAQAAELLFKATEAMESGDEVLAKKLLDEADRLMAEVDKEEGLSK